METIRPIETLKDVQAYEQGGPQYHTALLYGLAAALRPRRYLEIGTFKGGSLAAVNLAAEHYGFELQSVAIDPNPQPELQEVLQRFPSIELLRAKSQDVALAGLFDLAFIDGDHSLERAKADWNIVKEHMSIQGVIVLHDTFWIRGCHLLALEIMDYEPEWCIANLIAGPGIAICTRALGITFPTELVSCENEHAPTSKDQHPLSKRR